MKFFFALILVVVVFAIEAPVAKAQETVTKISGQHVEGNDLVDEDLLFRLKGKKGCRVLKSFRLKDPTSTLVGAIDFEDPKDGFASVRVLRFTGCTLEDYVAHKKLDDGVYGDPILFESKVLVGTQNVYRIVFSHVDKNSTKWVLAYAFWKRGDLIYSSIVTKPFLEGSENVISDEEWGRFSFKDGEPKFESYDSTTEMAHGIGWRVESGTLEQAAQKYVVDVPKGWRIRHAHEVISMNSGRGCLFSHEAVDVALIINSEKKGSNDFEFLKEGIISANESIFRSTRIKETMAYRIFGSMTAFTVLRSKESRFETRVCVLEHEGRVFRLVVRSELFSDSLERLLREFFSRLRPLSGDQLGKVVSALRSKRHPQSILTEHLSVRQGVVRCFKHGVSWKQPGWGFWNFREPAEKDESTLVFLATNVEDQFTFACFEQGHDQSAENELKRAARIAEVPEELLVPKTVQFKGEDWQQISATFVEKGGHRRCWMGLAKRRSSGVIMINCSAVEGGLDLSSAKLRSLLNEIDLKTELAKTTETDKHFKSHHFGFGVKIIESHSVIDFTAENMPPTIRIYKSVGEKDILTIYADHLFVGTNKHGYCGKLELEDMAESLEGFSLDDVTVDEVTVLGCKAICRSWENEEFFFLQHEFERDGTCFVIVQKGNHETPEYTDSFYFLD